MKLPIAQVSFFLAVVWSTQTISACLEPSTLPRCQSQPETDRKLNAPKYDVRVAVDVCTEDRDHILGSGEYATLNCQGDGGVYRILFPRKEWLDMRRDGTGLNNAGPGK